MSDSDADDVRQFLNQNSVALEQIHRAAMAGDLAALRRALEAGVSPDCLGHHYGTKCTPLSILCSNHISGPGFNGPDDIRLEAVKILLAAGASPDHIEGLRGDSPLCTAANYVSHPAVVKALIAAGADPTRADADGWTALHAAACWGPRTSRNAACAVALLRAGADVNALYRDIHGLWTPLKWCMSGASVRSRPSYVLPVLLRFGATIDMASVEEYSDLVGYAYLAKVDAAGGWKRYAQAHTARLAPIFAKIFPHARLPPELVAHIVDLWAHVGYY